MSGSAYLLKNTIGTHISVKEIGGTTESVEGGRLWGGKNVRWNFSKFG